VSTPTLPTGWRQNPALAQKTLETLRTARDKKIPAREWATPGELAAAINPKTIQTPALDIIDEALVWAHTTPDARLLISLPPQEGKSQRVTKTGSLWALTRNPETRIGIASYASALAESFGREIRNWITSFDGTDGTLDLRLRIAPDNGAAGRWSLEGHEGGVIAVGVGSGLTGRPLDCLIIDDPFADAEQAASESYRKKVWEWWQAVAATRLASPSPVIIVMTRWHEDDLAGRLLAAEDGAQWRVINIPAQADHSPEKGQTDPLGRQPGQWLESARNRTVAQWEAIKVRSGVRVFTALYQGKPSPDAGDVWKREWWRRYPTMLWSLGPDGGNYVDCDEMIMSWDMAFKDTKTADYVVGQVWARRGANVYLLDQVRRRMSFTDTLTMFQTMVARWPQAAAKLVEDKANGTAIISMLQNKVGGIIPINPTESKKARAEAVAPYIEAGNVHLPTTDVALFEVDELVEEAAAFPNGSHDDQVDATSQALNRLFLAGAGAEAWLEWMRQKAAAVTQPAPPAGPSPEPEAAVTEPETPEQIRAAARQAAFAAAQPRRR
jgi:predicted phage terminase large subunit-like protein